MIRIFTVIVVSLLFGACATDAGRKPVPVEGLAHVYEFTVYFNMGDFGQVETYAHNTALILSKQKGCKSYRLENMGNKLPGDQYYDYRVTLEC